VRPLFWTLVGFVASVLAVLGLAGAYFLGPAEAPGREAIVMVRPGQTLPAVARDLESQGLIRSARGLLFMARLRGRPATVKAGEFRVSSGWTAMETLRVITTTNGLQHRVAVREGLPWWAAAKLFEAEGLCDAVAFEKAMQNATLLAKFDIPGDTAEGFLFPETYMLPRSFDDGGTAAVEAMLREFAKQAKKLWPEGLPPADELRRLVILASLVERETGDPAERPRIAGVFANRLKKNMRLQCDPTTIYGLGPGFDGNLRRAHLEDAGNPYNTYAHAGLPPGPICSPGIESLRAAIHPEEHDFLYFVARGDGTHEFSRTLDEHNHAVARYQRHRAEGYRSTKS
jgi:UPF0755 protein